MVDVRESNASNTSNTGNTDYIEADAMVMEMVNSRRTNGQSLKATSNDFNSGRLDWNGPLRDCNGVRIVTYAKSDAQATHNLHKIVTRAEQEALLKKIKSTALTVGALISAAVLIWIALSIMDVNAHNTITTAGTARAAWNLFNLI